MKNLRKFIVQKKGSRFVANGIDADLGIYLAVVSHYDKYVAVDPLKSEKDGTIPAFAWFDDLIESKVAEEISEEEFRGYLSQAMGPGYDFENSVGEKFPLFLASPAPRPPKDPVLVTIPCDPKIKADMTGLADQCEFRQIKTCFRKKLYGVEMIIVVNGRYRLNEVAAIMVKRGAADYGELMKAGVFKFGVDDMSGVLPGWAANMVLLDSIPGHKRCSAILLPPNYVVQFVEEHSGDGW